MDCMTSPGSFFDDRVMVGISSSLGFGFGFGTGFLVDGFLSKKPFFRPFFMPSPKDFFMRFSSFRRLCRALGLVLQSVAHHQIG